MKAKKNFLALLLCLVASIAMTACDSEKTNRSQLVGTWVEQTDLYNVELMLTENDTFEFRTNGYAPQLDGSGTYKYTQRGYDHSVNPGSYNTNYHLTLNYSAKAEHTFEVTTISSRHLVIEDRTRFKFSFTRK